MKLTSILKIICMGMVLCTLTACGNTENTQAVQDTPSASTGVYVPNQTGKPMSEDIKDELETKHKQEAASIKTIQEEPKGSHKGQRILIAYFTWGGRSGEVAHMIHDKIGGDIYEIKRNPDYSRDYSTVLKESVKEVDDNARPQLAGERPDFSQYDVIVLGYPCWWFTAPMIIPSFLEGQNLEGKLIVPYMCSYSSPFEVTLPALAAAAPGARIFKGLTLDKDTDYGVIDSWLVQAGLL